MPGYIKNVGDHIRMRWVQPGFDPDATDVPPNKVIFDSDDLGTLSVFTAGEVALPTAQSSYTQLVTWNLDYVPLCWFQYRLINSSGGFPFEVGYLRNYLGASVSYDFRVNVRKTGIWFRGYPPYAWNLVYAAFRVKASDG